MPGLKSRLETSFGESDVLSTSLLQSTGNRYFWNELRHCRPLPNNSHRHFVILPNIPQSNIRRFVQASINDFALWQRGLRTPDLEVNIRIKAAKR